MTSVKSTTREIGVFEGGETTTKDVAGDRVEIEGAAEGVGSAIDGAQLQSKVTTAAIASDSNTCIRDATVRSKNSTADAVHNSEPRTVETAGICNSSVRDTTGEVGTTAEDATGGHVTDTSTCTGTTLSIVGIKEGNPEF